MRLSIRCLAVLLVWLLINPDTVFCQSKEFRSRYENAKDLFSQERYNLAMEAFKSLTSNDEENQLTPYTGYFYALSAYHAGYHSLAKDMFMQLTIKHPLWEKMSEANLWLSRIGFETSGLFQGMMYAADVNGSEDLQSRNKKQKLFYLEKADNNSLLNIYEQYPEDIEVGFALAKSIESQPFEERDIALLSQLLEKFDLNENIFITQIHKDVFKEKYHIAVLLPLFIERMAASGGYLKKSLAVDILEGISMALADIDSSRLDIHVYDTKMDSSTTAKMLKQPEMKSYDAIIGPLFQVPSLLVSSFAYDNQVNMINPASRNPVIAKKNPYAFLFKTDAGSLGEKVGDFVCNTITNKVAAIYYGTSSNDSLTALAYQKRIENDSFQVVIMRRIGPENKREIFDVLAASKDILDTVAIAKMTSEEIRNTRKLPTMDSLFIKPDSIGHIFLATDKQTLAAEVMAAVVTRRDSIQIVGIGDWFSEPNASLDLIEKLNAWIALSPQENLGSAENIALRQRYISIYHINPRKYFFMGYFTMKFLSTSLLRYGVYFQNGFNRTDEPNGLWDFNNSFSNQNVQMMNLVDGKIEPFTPSTGNSEGG